MKNILKTLTTLCTKVDIIGLRVQKLETNEEILKSKAKSQQHDYKHAELQGDVGKLQKTHIKVCLNTVAGTSKKDSEKPKNTNLEQMNKNDKITRNTK